jgi:hypothetical protein
MAALTAQRAMVVCEITIANNLRGARHAVLTLCGRTVSKGTTFFFSRRVNTQGRQRRPRLPMTCCTTPAARPRRTHSYSHLQCTGGCLPVTATGAGLNRVSTVNRWSRTSSASWRVRQYFEGLMPATDASRPNVLPATDALRDTGRSEFTRDFPG